MATSNTSFVKILVDTDDCKVVKINSACTVVKYHKSVNTADAFAIEPAAGNIKLVPAGTILRLTDKRYNYTFFPNLYTHIYADKTDIKV